MRFAVRVGMRTAKIDAALDRWLLHPVFGLLTLAVVMFLIFQAVYAWATPLMDGMTGCLVNVRTFLNSDKASYSLIRATINFQVLNFIWHRGRDVTYK